MLAQAPLFDTPPRMQVVPWKQCLICEATSFKSPREFCHHLRLLHCTKEGGSYVCNYGPNGICKYLPLEGVCDKDYEVHVNRYHVSVTSNTTTTTTTTAATTTKNRQYSMAHHKRTPSSSSTGSIGAASNSSRGKSRVSSQRQGAIDIRDTDSDSDASVASRNYGEVSETETKHKQRRFKWTVYHAKVNMPALLNDPRPGKRQPDFFTKTWGVGWDYLDLSPHPEIPAITSDHFLKYLKAIAPRLGRHRRNQANPPDPKVPIDAFPVLYTRAHDKASADLSKVPKMFITSAFNLEDENVFNAVFPWNEVAQAHGQSKRLLQEQFSHYLDIIEVQIARQVALKSEAFFHVMTSHEALQTRLADSVKSITDLRAKMKAIDTKLVQRPFSLVRLSQKKQRLSLITRKLKLMSTLHQTQPTVQILLSSSDYVGALDIISMSQEILNKELNGIKSFRHLSSQLSEMEHVIGSMVRQEFGTFITKDLNRPVAEGYGTFDEEHLTAVYMGLLRQHSHDFVEIYRDEACTTVKSSVKQSVIEYVSASEHSDTLTGAGLADQMRLLSFGSWLPLLEDIFTHLLVILNRVRVICSTLAHLTKQAAGVDDSYIPELAEQDVPVDINNSDKSSIITEMTCEKILKQLNDLLGAISEQGNERCAKVVNARSKDSFMDSLSSHEFFSLMSSVEKFTKACDLIGGRKSNTLRSCLQGQSSRFINKFHEERKAKINLSLDNERWRVAEIPHNIQALVTHAEMCEQLVISDEINGSHGPPLEQLTVNGQTYCIVGTVISLVKMVLEYCTCVEDMPKSASDILTRFVELLKLFNSRTSQLVLGAGALQLGLRTISAKNLALVWRCLQLLIYYLPHVKTHFAVYLSGQKASQLRHIVTVEQDYTLHVRAIEQKLGELASTMFDSCIAQWEIKAPMPSSCFRLLTKQLIKFYEATCDVLSSDDLKSLFAKVNTLLRAKLKERLRVLNMTSLTGPQQGLIMADLTFFAQNTTTLSPSLSFSLKLNDLISR